MNARLLAAIFLIGVAAAGCNKNGLIAGSEATPAPDPTPTDPPEYLGKAFFAVDLDNLTESPLSDAAAAQFAVAVSNPDIALTATIRVSNSTGEIQSADVSPGSLKIFELPRADIDGTTLVPNAYLIESNVPVTAHQFNPLGNVLVYSNDASLLLPVAALAEEYRAMSWQQSGATGLFPLPGFVTVVAVEPGATSVSITPTCATNAGGGIPALAAGETHTQELQQFDVLSVETAAYGLDLTGTLVTADRRISVFGGAECAFVPSGVGQCDHLEEQMFPIHAWGKTYVAAKSRPRGTEPDIWRILATTDGTTVTTQPAQSGTPVTLDAGEFVEIETPASFVVSASAPVMVGQYLVGQEWGGGGPTGDTGDPDFILSVPVEQYRSDYLFLTPPNYANDTITVIAPATATVSLDGAEIPAGSFVETLTGSGWAVATMPVVDGTHHVTADQPVGLTVIGYDQYVSYGFPGGLDLVDLTP